MSTLESARVVLSGWDAANGHLLEDGYREPDYITALRALIAERDALIRWIDDMLTLPVYTNLRSGLAAETVAEYRHWRRLITEGPS